MKYVYIGFHSLTRRNVVAVKLIDAESDSFAMSLVLDWIDQCADAGIDIVEIWDLDNDSLVAKVTV